MGVDIITCQNCGDNRHPDNLVQCEQCYKRYCKDNGDCNPDFSGDPYDDNYYIERCLQCEMSLTEKCYEHVREILKLIKKSSESKSDKKEAIDACIEALSECDF